LLVLVLVLVLPVLPWLLLNSCGSNQHPSACCQDRPCWSGVSCSTLSAAAAALAALLPASELMGILIYDMTASGTPASRWQHLPEDQ
jgi:hypothetical protein